MSGIYRRIDELGRIVIPKEIRKSLRIHEGDNLEISVDDLDKIILKKKSILNKIDEVAKNITDTIYNLFKLNAFITDKDVVVAASGPLKKEYQNKPISEMLEMSIKRRDDVVENYKKNISIIKNKEIEATYIINSIVVDGDVIGLIILLSIDEQVKDVHVNISKMASQFLSKYLEE